VLGTVILALSALATALLTIDIALPEFHWVNPR